MRSLLAAGALLLALEFLAGLWKESQKGGSNKKLMIFGWLILYEFLHLRLQPLHWLGMVLVRLVRPRSVWVRTFIRRGIAVAITRLSTGLRSLRGRESPAGYGYTGTLAGYAGGSIDCPAVWSFSKSHFDSTADGTMFLLGNIWGTCSLIILFTQSELR